MEKANPRSDETDEHLRSRRETTRDLVQRMLRKVSAVAAALDGETTTTAIDAAATDHPADPAFTDAAAFALVSGDPHRMSDSSRDTHAEVRSEGLGDSDAIGNTLRETAAHRRLRSSGPDEVHRIAADEADRKEMRIVREQLADLAPLPRD